MEVDYARELKHLLLHAQEPLVFKKQLHWELLTWNLQKWESLLKNEEMTFRCGKNAYTKEPQWERITETVKSTFKDFLFFINHESKSWMYFDYKYLKDWFHNVDELNNDIDWSQFGFPELTSKDCTIWIGSQGAHTPCHVDTYGWNLVAQVYGRKQWILFPPEENLRPTRIPYEESSIYSSLNFFSPVVNDFKGIGNCRKIILNPGDVLFVPHKWWHFVENIDTAISVNVWLPSPEDDEERLKESLVQLFISQIMKEVDGETKSIILNPNSDEELKNLTFDTSLNLTSKCKNIVTNCNKRIRLSEQSNEKTSFNINSLTEIYKYSFIHKIPTLSQQEFESFLQEQINRFGEVSEDSNGDVNKELVNIVNAFTHPEVISLVKNKLLQ